MFEIALHPIFAKWRDKLKDDRARSKIAQRIVRLRAGNFGDAKFFDGIGELRIHYGPGYRVYFVEQDGQLIILLCGGDKGSQRRDIEKAKELAEEIRRDGYETD